MEMDEKVEMGQAIARQIYWNQLETSRHHFFKIMKFFRSELRVPKKFVMKFPVRLGKTVKLNGQQMGNVWEVRVVETEEDVVFREGWGQFVDDHHLNEADLVVFQYTGKSAFQVLLFDRTGCPKGLRMIQDQLGIKPHFFKMMTLELRSKLLIPRKLVRNFYEKLAGTISLKGPSGNVWEVGVERTEEDVFLRKGWGEFVSDHSLDELDFLVFRYTGDSSFSVLIFDLSGCEKESSHFIKPRVQPADLPTGHGAKGRKRPAEEKKNTQSESKDENSMKERITKMQTRL